MRAEELQFTVLLVGLNFLATAVGVRVCHVVGMYKIKPLGQIQVRLRS